MTTSESSRARLSWLLAAALLAGTVVLGWYAVDRWRQGAPDPLAEAPVGVAGAAARDFFTLDYRHVDDDIARVQRRATGAFAREYRTQSEQLRANVLDKHLVLTASVPSGGAAVEHLGADEVWVLVPVDVRTTADGKPQGDQRYRTRVVLDRVGDGWRISRLEQVG